jgi:serine/threonine-protein kinase
VVHRDIKPANILVSPQGVPKLVDFGIAKLLASTETSPETRDLTRGRGAPMTPEYASPEQIRAEPVTTASDVYSLGVLLYELLTGTLPYRLDRRTVEEITRAVCDQDPEPPSSAVLRSPTHPYGDRIPSKTLRRLLSGDLDAILLKALRKEPSLRFDSVEQLSEDIRRYLDGLPVLAQRDAFSYRAKKFVWRHKGAVGAAAAIVVVLVAAVIVTARQARIAADERDRARTSAAKAEQINAFLRDMVGSADPYTEGKDVTVAQTLGRAVQRIDGTLGGQPEVAAALRSTIGNTYVNLGLDNEAEPLLRRALADRQRLFGKDHPDVASSLGDLAFLMLDKHELDQADELYRQSLEMYRRLGLSQDFGVIAILSGWGRVARDKGDDGAAEARFREALALAHGSPEAERLSADLLNDLAILRQSHSDLDEAEKMYRDALAIIGRLRGPESPEMATGLSNLSGVLAAKGDLAGAEALSGSALAMKRKLLGDTHPELAFALFNHADNLDRNGKPAEAIPLVREVLSMRGKSLAHDGPLVAGALLLLGRCLTHAGDPRAGEPFLREALALRLKILPAGHWLTANTESTLGECLVAEGRLKDAEPLLLTSYERLKADRGDRHEATIAARARLVHLYEAWKRPSDADRYRAGTIVGGAK